MKAAGVVLLFMATGAAAVPEPGRYEGRLCVATNPAQPASCGPAELELLPDGLALVRISDIVYRLRLNGSQVDVVLMQGPMQIDGFRTACRWSGNSLSFEDTEKRARYEVQFGVRKASDSR